MNKHLEQVRAYLDKAWTFVFADNNEAHDNAVLDAIEAAQSALSAHEEEVRGLVDTLRGIRVCAQIDGRPEWLTVAEEINKTLAKFQGEKE